MWSCEDPSQLLRALTGSPQVHNSSGCIFAKFGQLVLRAALGSPAEGAFWPLSHQMRGSWAGSAQQSGETGFWVQAEMKCRPWLTRCVAPGRNSSRRQAPEIQEQVCSENRWGHGLQKSQAPSPSCRGRNRGSRRFRGGGNLPIQPLSEDKVAIWSGSLVGRGAGCPSGSRLCPPPGSSPCLLGTWEPGRRCFDPPPTPPKGQGPGFLSENCSCCSFPCACPDPEKGLGARLAGLERGGGEMGTAIQGADGRSQEARSRGSIRSQSPGFVSPPGREVGPGKGGPPGGAGASWLWRAIPHVSLSLLPHLGTFCLRSALSVSGMNE